MRTRTLLVLAALGTASFGAQQMWGRGARDRGAAIRHRTIRHDAIRNDKFKELFGKEAHLAEEFAAEFRSEASDARNRARHATNTVSRERYETLYRESALTAQNLERCARDARIDATEPNDLQARYHDATTGHLVSQDANEREAGDIDLDRSVSNGPITATDATVSFGEPGGQQMASQNVDKNSAEYAKQQKEALEAYVERGNVRLKAYQLTAKRYGDLMGIYQARLATDPGFEAEYEAARKEYRKHVHNLAFDRPFGSKAAHMNAAERAVHHSAMAGVYVMRAVAEGNALEEAWKKIDLFDQAMWERMGLPVREEFVPTRSPRSHTVPPEPATKEKTERQTERAKRELCSNTRPSA